MDRKSMAIFGEKKSPEAFAPGLFVALYWD
jgi:hypothetical protein